MGEKRLKIPYQGKAKGSSRRHQWGHGPGSEERGIGTKIHRQHMARERPGRRK